MQINIDAAHQFALSLIPVLTRLGLKLLGAVAFWVIGRWIIHWLIQRIKGPLTVRTDATIARYLDSALSAVLTVCLVIGIAGFVGIETATFAALLAGAGLAIGTAWGDLLKGFAAGVFLLSLRPFRVGDEVTVAGVSGRVDEIGIFICVVRTADHVLVTINNHKIFSDNIRNYSRPAARRLDLRIQLAHNTDYKKAIALIEERLPAIANIVPSPAPAVSLAEITPAGPVVIIQPFCQDQHAAQVATDCNRAALDALTLAGFFLPPPPTLAVTLKREQPTA